MKLLLCLTGAIFATGMYFQPLSFNDNQPVSTTAPNKPYKILTNGKQVSIKANKDIRHLMVWTSGGHRILEEKNVNSSQYQFRISVNEKVFFLMIKLSDDKVYSEKIGL